MEKPIFETSVTGFHSKVYSDRVTYKAILSGEISFPINQIASIEKGFPGTQKVMIETTGGRRYTLVVRLKDIQAFCDAIYQAKKII